MNEVVNLQQEQMEKLVTDLEKINPVVPVNQDLKSLVYFEVKNEVKIKGNPSINKLVPAHVYQVDRVLYAKLQNELGHGLYNMTPSVIRSTVNQLCVMGFYNEQTTHA